MDWERLAQLLCMFFIGLAVGYSGGYQMWGGRK